MEHMAMYHGSEKISKVFDKSGFAIRMQSMFKYGYRTSCWIMILGTRGHLRRQNLMCVND